jgi:hypothetical protein
MNNTLRLSLYPSPQRKLGSADAVPLADMIQGMPAFAGMTGETNSIFYRHPGESRDPTNRANDVEVYHAELWIPAFAGMTNLNCHSPHHVERELEVTP